MRTRMIWLISYESYDKRTFAGQAFGQKAMLAGVGGDLFQYKTASSSS